MTVVDTALQLLNLFAQNESFRAHRWCISSAGGHHLYWVRNQHKTEIPLTDSMGEAIALRWPSVYPKPALRPKDLLALMGVSDKEYQQACRQAKVARQRRAALEQNRWDLVRCREVMGKAQALLAAHPAWEIALPVEAAIARIDALLGEQDNG